jgi:hypothetical protein
VSNFGKVKSIKFGKEIILKPRLNKSGYYYVNLWKNGNVKSLNVHQLVAIAFLNHIPNGYKLVVNHINFIKTDNTVGNLELITHRENTNRKHLPSTSKYVGVRWDDKIKKWRSAIVLNKKQIHLGTFINELEAAKAYNNKLNEILI